MQQENITFIDLFAGIGGFRLRFENAGFKCVYSNEIDKHAGWLTRSFKYDLEQIQSKNNN